MDETADPDAFAQVGAGVDAPAWAIHDIGGTRFIGGEFRFLGDATAAVRLAKINASGVLVSAGVEFNGAVRAFVDFDGKTYVLGEFTTIDGVPFLQIARTTDGVTFEEFTTFGGSTYAGLVADGKLWVGGKQLTSGGVVAPGLASWAGDGNPWVAAFTEFTTTGGAPGAIYAMVESGGYIYFGGTFNTVNGVACNNVARLEISTGTVTALGSGVPGRVAALAVLSGDLWVGGEFTGAAGGTADYVAKYNIAGGTWSADTLGAADWTGPVELLHVESGTLYASGKRGGFSTPTVGLFENTGSASG